MLWPQKDLVDLIRCMYLAIDN